MNVNQVLSLVHRLLEEEAVHSIQTKLAELQRALENLMASPVNNDLETEARHRLDRISAAISIIEQRHTSAIRARMAEIGATPYFSRQIIGELDVIQTSADSSSSAREMVQSLITKRARFIERLKILEASLIGFGFSHELPPEGEAEIGFQLPRNLFSNELGGLARELQELRLIIRAFSEVAGNAGEPIEVRQISTTDPVFFVMVGLITTKLVAEAVAWSLDQWGKIESIRKIRAETAKLGMGSAGDDILLKFDEMIKEILKSAQRLEADRLVGNSEQEPGRRNELVTYVEMALAGISARIERGMTIELRLSPPVGSLKEGNEDHEGVTTAQGQLADTLNELRTIESKLVFPAPSDAPVISIPNLRASEQTGEAS